MSDIVLATVNAKWVHPSYALRLLKANLAELETRAEILEFNLRQPLCEKVDAILAARPRLLGLSVSIWNHEATLELLRALAGHWRNATADAGRPIIVLGGPEASYLSDEAPLLREADWLVRGEGEIAFRTLCRFLLAESAADYDTDRPVARTELCLDPAVGVIRPLTEPTNDGRVRRAIEAQPIDLAAIDPAYRLYSDTDLARKMVYVEASRGCPFGCDFCLSALDRRVRFVPQDRFLADMASLIARGAKGFKLLDRTFNLDIGRAVAIARFFRERFVASGRGESERYVHFELVPQRCPSDLLEEFARFPAGSLRLEIGIQTFNPDVARTIGRAPFNDADLAVLGFLREKTAAIVHADLIIGLPGEDLASFGAGFDRLWTVRPTEIQVGVLKKLPGALIARHDAAFDMVYADLPPYEVIATGALNREDCDRLKTFARFWEIVVNRGHFADLVPGLLPEGGSVFGRFLELSDRLRARFGRSWGIPREELRKELEAAIDG